MSNLGGKETKIKIEITTERVERMGGERARDAHTAFTEISHDRGMIPDYRLGKGE